MMAIYRWTICHLTIILIQVCFIHSEIHRAKTSSLKTGKFRTETYVAEETKSDLFETVNTFNNNSTVTNMTGIKYEIWAYSLLGSVLVGLSGIFPLLVIPLEAGPALKHGAAASRLKLLLSFAVGGLLGDVFLHLLPEAWEHIDQGDHDRHVNVGLLVIAGMLSFLIIEKCFAREGEFEPIKDECSDEDEDTTRQILTNGKQKLQMNGQTPSTKQRLKSKTQKSSNSKKSKQLNNNVKQEAKSPVEEIKISGYLNLAANVVDNFTHGLAVAGGFLVSEKVGFITLIAILLHEIPHEIGDFAILLRSGFDRWKAAKAQLLTATGGMVGALTALLADSAQSAGDSTAWILPFTSGGFIYIALVTVVPDLLEEHHPRESVKQVVFMLAGVAAMYGVTIIN